MEAHLLFEQSGTFKNAFIKNGVQAYDYDILNDFGETDFQIDIFKEIQEAYVGGAKCVRQYIARRCGFCILSMHKV